MQMTVISKCPSMMALIALLALLATFSRVESRNTKQTRLSPILLYLGTPDSEDLDDLSIQRPSKRNSEERCAAQQERPELLFVMEQVCIHCNEFYSHEQANVRSRCRADCFGSELFKMCLNHFAKRTTMF